MTDILQTLWQGILAMSPIEGFAVIFSLLYVWLAAKESIWCWPASMVSVLLYVYLCAKAHLYAETALQFYYIGTTIYGWYHWQKGSQKEDKLPISLMKLQQHAIFILAGFSLTLLSGYLLSTYTNAALPYVDSFTTVFSIMTTILVTRKVLENWLYWIVIDAVGMYQYYQKDLFFTSVLFFFYVIMSVYGFIVWQRTWKVEVSTK